MWSLPDIKVLNSEAHQNRKKLERAARTGILDRKKMTCQWADHDDPSKCEGELRHYLVHDIFSDDPKDILTLCEHHDGYYGSPSEGYFECTDCNRVMAENYTWEMYEHVTEDGESICIPCYADRVLRDEERWLTLTEQNIAALTFGQVKKAPHVIAVQMPIPKGIEFYENTECDSSTGGRLTGFSSCESSPNGAVTELQDALRKAMAEGHTKAILILDATYQFSVSIGIYLPTKGGAYDVAEVAA